jgi:hypothetical protein
MSQTTDHSWEELWSATEFLINASWLFCQRRDDIGALGKHHHDRRPPTSPKTPSLPAPGSHHFLVERRAGNSEEAGRHHAGHQPRRSICLCGPPSAARRQYQAEGICSLGRKSPFNADVRQRTGGSLGIGRQYPSCRFRDCGRPDCVSQMGRELITRGTPFPTLGALPFASVKGTMHELSIEPHLWGA